MYGIEKVPVVRHMEDTEEEEHVITLSPVVCSGTIRMAVCMNQSLTAVEGLVAEEVQVGHLDVN